MLKQKIVGAAVSLLLLVAGNAFAAQTEILTYAAPGDTTTVSINRDILQLPDGSLATVTLPTGAKAVVEVKRIRIRQTTSSFLGKITTSGQTGSIALTFDASSVYGRITAAPDAWEVKDNGDGTVTLIDESTRPRLTPGGSDVVPTDPREIEPPTPQVLGEYGGPSGASSSATPEIDVLMLYSQDFEDEYPEPATKLQALLDVVNTAFLNTGIDAELVLAGAEKIAQPVGETTYDVLSAMKDNTGLYADLDLMRAEYSADLVTMVRGPHPGSSIDPYCGWGSIPYYNTAGELTSSSAVFSAMWNGGSCGDSTFAHEIGHNFGGGHDHNTTCTGLDAWSCGYVVSSSFKTYMAYGFESGAGVFSDPSITTCGPGGAFDCGVDHLDPVEPADNARTFRNTSSVIANYAPGTVTIWHPYEDAVVSRGVEHKMFFSREMHVGEELDIDLMKDGAVVTSLGTHTNTSTAYGGTVCTSSACEYRDGWYSGDYIGALCTGEVDCEAIYAKRIFYTIPLSVDEGDGYSIRVTNAGNPTDYVWYSKEFTVAGPGIVVSPDTGLSVSEDGSTQVVTVRLASPPMETVSFSVASSDTSEMTVSASLMTFTSSNWDTTRNLTLTGVDDGDEDGDQSVSVIFGNATGGGGRVYINQSLPPLSVTVLDNDASSSVDSDDDGVVDSADAFPDDPFEWNDTDNDGVGDNADAFPNDASESNDADSDGVGDNADAFPDDASESADTDNDGVGDNADRFPTDASESVDTDNDGVGDNADAFPTDASETADTDNDGVGDNADAFPTDAGETADTDNDGVGDNADAFPTDASETADTDNDGVGNNADAFPNDASETADADNDGTGDNADAFPSDASEFADSDNDGVGDNADAFPNDGTETEDSDNDGVGNNADVFPNNPAESADTDNDGVGDNADAFPTNAAEHTDSDNDGIGDNADAFPQDANESADSDNDGIPDGIDPDVTEVISTRDSDFGGIPDYWEYQYGLDPLSNTDDTSDADNDGISLIDEYRWGGDPTVADADSDNDGIRDIVDSDPASSLDSGIAQWLTPDIANNELVGYRTTTGGDHYSVARYGFFSNSGNEDLLLFARGWDAQTNTEISVSINGVKIGYLRRGENRSQGKKSRFLIPRNLMVAGRNIIDIRRDVPGKRWGVSTITVKSITQSTIPLRIGEKEKGQYGHKYGNGTHKAFARFSIVPPRANMTLVIRGYDIDTANEAAVYVNDAFRGYLPTSANNALGGKATFALTLNPNETNFIEVRQMMRLNQKWGVTSVVIK